VVKVIKSGFYTTVQDLGRLGFQQYGVPVSGVMDSYSARLANALLNNDIDAAVLEITMTGPVIVFTSDTLICISGADISPQCNKDSIKLNHVIKITKGDEISFGKLQFGFRCYLAVYDGFQTELVMKSKSMYKNITSPFIISDGDELSISDYNAETEISHSSIKVNSDHFESKELKTFKGPEFEKLSKKQQKLLFSNDFTIAKENSRMAYQLNERIENNLKPIITSLVLPGTVQLTPSGQLIVLMRDCQTTGGYPRVLQLCEKSISILSQKFTGNAIHFEQKE